MQCSRTASWVREEAQTSSDPRCARSPALGGGVWRRQARGSMPSQVGVWVGLFLAVQICCGPMLAAAAGANRYQSGAWITVCEHEPGGGAPGCSLTVPFSGIQNGRGGSFALLVDLDSGIIGIVGQPFPVRAILRVDKGLPIECHEMRYCLFPQDQSLTAIKDLEIGSLILIDVDTARAAFKFSLTPRGYQAGIAQIRAWGYPLPWD